jgi:L-aspartate oxidase
VEFVVRRAKKCLEELIELGVDFSTEVTADGKRISLGMEGGHSRRRIVHAHDSTGRHVESVLIERVKASENITIFEDHLAIDLILESRMRGIPMKPDRCWGCYALDRKSGEIKPFQAYVTILATGGAGKVYLYTSNPDIATGDGVAMAHRAGAKCMNLEFVQFHPTCLYHPEAKSFLISEAVRGEGAVLRTLDGDRFMPRYHPDAELAPRDVVARSIDLEMKKRGHKYVLLDLTPIGKIRVKKRFPNIYETCLKYGYDITKEPIPVVPAAHYMCGGVCVDIKAQTTIERLLAVGEVAATGMHGANRLASNSLLEAIVFADVAAKTAEHIFQEQKGSMPIASQWVGEGTVPIDEVVVLDHDWDQVRSLMWDYVGIVRSDQRLETARKRIRLIREQIETYYRKYVLNADLVELRNIAYVAELIITCAMLRRESRGLHYNIDCPYTDDQNWLRDTVI